MKLNERYIDREEECVTLNTHIYRFTISFGCSTRLYVMMFQRHIIASFIALLPLFILCMKTFQIHVLACLSLL